MLESSGIQPVFVTVDGYDSKIPVNLDFYDNVEDLLFDLELEVRYRKSETNGKNVDAEEFLKNLKAELLRGHSI